MYIACHAQQKLKNKINKKDVKRREVFAFDRTVVYSILRAALRSNALFGHVFLVAYLISIYITLMTTYFLFSLRSWILPVKNRIVIFMLRTNQK